MTVRQQKAVEYMRMGEMVILMEVESVDIVQHMEVEYIWTKQAFT